MVRPREVHHLEGEHLRAEVGSITKHDGQVDLSERVCLRSRDHAVEGRAHRTQAYPLGQIDLPITFGDQANFCSEILTFEVVDFLGSYHAILGRPCYAKFMAIPNYTYSR